MSDYTTGEQPCTAFAPMDDLFPGSGNVHECLAPFKSANGTPCCAQTSGGSVSFCTHCNRDHHSGGYQTCAARKEAP